MDDVASTPDLPRSISLHYTENQMRKQAREQSAQVFFHFPEWRDFLGHVWGRVGGHEWEALAQNWPRPIRCIPPTSTHRNTSHGDRLHEKTTLRVGKIEIYTQTAQSLEIFNKSSPNLNTVSIYWTVGIELTFWRLRAKSNHCNSLRYQKLAIYCLGSW